ncbi:MAG: tRNA (adenosine(37)-N6)-threonylcarbamoyltransferase complex ATPase subunit type 1 TsaE [Candidatus Pacebacteria bacterium]|nr:tRNA (adenosine(37)-N6)-threonylcarbamoyltransferase complex ATPase subunit type 1 TsaE [Candidatus Paceibacterota bacterium]
MKRSYSKEDLSSIAKESLSLLDISKNKATVVALQGELGAGKTTLVQAIAKELGVEEVVTSPTFVLAKWYKTTNDNFYVLVHIDAYRVESESELETLGFQDLLKEPKSLVIIEWPEKIPNILSNIKTQTFLLKHEEEKRTIEGPLLYEEKK